jgi:uncharacterized protein YbjT (DUF2867 family)
MADVTPPPVLVTGATGFTGGDLALTLRRQSVPVRALVRPGANVAALEADLRNAEDVERAAKGSSGLRLIRAPPRLFLSSRASSPTRLLSRAFSRWRGTGSATGSTAPG